MMTVQLNMAEYDQLFGPDDMEDTDLRVLLARLRRQYSPRTDELTLFSNDLTRLQRYGSGTASSQSRSRLQAILGRHLGPQLDGVRVA